MTAVADLVAAVSGALVAIGLIVVLLLIGLGTIASVLEVERQRERRSMAHRPTWWER